ncbi:hypothetical protein DM02DRAFT_318250 [Periconia macrospinosa]|uniref:Uncharacterized protein n=1 Tax=Periconia macrospinosa TaxID=97972 RepID=A0A2V1DXU0_9PLEO|nr:hypothetical protein DM02DRAFT_318250 [Periconia macrospinosa]
MPFASQDRNAGRRRVVSWLVDQRLPRLASSPPSPPSPSCGSWLNRLAGWWWSREFASHDSPVTSEGQRCRGLALGRYGTTPNRPSSFPTRLSQRSPHVDGCSVAAASGWQTTASAGLAPVPSCVVRCLSACLPAYSTTCLRMYLPAGVPACPLLAAPLSVVCPLWPPSGPPLPTLPTLVSCTPDF